eukprot:TRINITY_DN399_c0_g1_i2.p1 TRINITY_DN399_c0_g1~~TRINITY_DN399_c0_g1_i2.p1  ORF type:complete len:140 (-),score=31.50 TRINITY_DN399_c0_g1_i2:135-554(-)
MLQAPIPGAPGSYDAHGSWNVSGFFGPSDGNFVMVFEKTEKVDDGRIEIEGKIYDRVGLATFNGEYNPYANTFDFVKRYNEAAISNGGASTDISYKCSQKEGVLYEGTFNMGVPFDFPFRVAFSPETQKKFIEMVSIEE